ncbi:hypothetical protein ACFSQD_18475 [Flavihumibacter stibioxidans]|uniref:Uncharacterized protein n=1 Tax=Flavihumibacter stibioxidans TaxID=1834163 RepID=A0ABR7MC35_9BACT|nr:hypothetical protein [Flavihumibacter stibioxidans]MBC6492601.1 hypothetical protein [Flavihumibacter stibioxidans]
MTFSPAHQFHIPVMGLAYTIDSPVKVARFGISSVVSIVEDRLIEMMRKHYYEAYGLNYSPIPETLPDYRAKRITDYLNLMQSIIQQQVEKLRKAAFEKGSEIVQYFEMLPDDSRLKQLYLQMLGTENIPEKTRLENQLRSQVQPGSIDVNIMTKVDRDHINKEGQLVENGSDAIAALRGYANSKLTHSSVVFSAGLNPRLYNYIEKCEAFDLDEEGYAPKKIIIKVSDYRSALIQGKYLAKKGRWVSEFRIESGLNCGGHAFATDGFLLGPILEEFKEKKQELAETMFELYTASNKQKQKPIPAVVPPVAITVQGGVGTSAEARFLQDRYKVNSIGWGTPFLLVPEATTVDDNTLQKLSRATEKDMVLSHSSPLGVRFHYLKGTTAEEERVSRIKAGKPGSPCTEKHLAFNTEFTSEPICTASRKYQKLKIADLQSKHLPEREYRKQLDEVLEKECLCVGLSSSAALKYKEEFIRKREAVTICPGPNIVNFSRIVSLRTMTDHIYGRTNIMTNPGRPHMFITELHLYIDYLREQLEGGEKADDLPEKQKKYCAAFYSNLLEGIQYYRNIGELAGKDDHFRNSLEYAAIELDVLNFRYRLS